MEHKPKFESGDKIYIANGFDRNQSCLGVVLDVWVSYGEYQYLVKLIRYWKNKAGEATSYYTVTGCYSEKELGKLGTYNAEYDWMHPKKEYEFLDKIDTLPGEGD